VPLLSPLVGFVAAGIVDVADVFIDDAEEDEEAEGGEDFVGELDVLDIEDVDGFEVLEDGEDFVGDLDVLERVREVDGTAFEVVGAPDVPDETMSTAVSVPHRFLILVAQASCPAALFAFAATQSV